MTRGVPGRLLLRVAGSPGRRIAVYDGVRGRSWQSAPVATAGPAVRTPSAPTRPAIP
ncbi:hypothetical protein [Streptomyces sp. NPDC088766]|uniref:hypothetical protein n=1 Tax=Streptomyces sp. NPDC088766 TaxID=3365893 RepID=UPI00381E417C